MESFYVQYHSSTIHYCKAGVGSKIVFCFHGYSQSALSFSFLENVLGQDYTIIAIDLPFHGETIWNEGLRFTPEMMLEILAKIKAAHSIENKKFYMLGFSMGGRVALSIFPLVSDEVEKLLLLAPDGLKLNFWYWISTQTKIGNRLFRYFMKKPFFIFNVLKIANKIGMVNQSIFKFISFYIYDLQVCDELYKRWTTMSGFRPKIKIIKSVINENKTPLRMLYGSHDRIIRFERAEQFRKGIEAFCQIKIVPTGHLLLIDTNKDVIIEMLKD